MLFFNIHGNKILCFFLPCFLFSLLLKPHGNSDAAGFFSYYFFAVKTNIGITLSSPKVFSIIESSNIYLIRACNALRHIFSHLKTKEKFLNSFRNCNFLHPEGNKVRILGTYCKAAKKLDYVRK